MKTPDQTQNTKPVVPSLFQVAAHFEKPDPAATTKSMPPPGQTPFADLMLHPENLDEVLKAAATEDRTSSQSPARRATRRAPREKQEGNSVGKPAGHSPGPLKRIDFFLEAPSAKSVKLVGDFTEWEKFARDMIRSENGVWHTAVSLPPGYHAYRFIVDGQWCDDPLPALRAPNPFGTVNAVAIVT